MGCLSATVKDLSLAASVATCCPSRRTLTETTLVTSQDTVTSCPTSGLAGLHVQDNQPAGPGQGQDSDGGDGGEKAKRHSTIFTGAGRGCQPRRGPGHGAVETMILASLEAIPNATDAETIRPTELHPPMACSNSVSSVWKLAIHRSGGPDFPVLFCLISGKMLRCKRDSTLHLYTKSP